MKVIKIALLFFLLPLYTFSQVFDAEIIDYTQTVSVDEDKLVSTDNYKILINKRAEEERFTDIEIIYKNNEKITSVEGHIEDLQGNTIRQLQKKDIKTSNAQTGISFYDDYMSMNFSLRHNIYPYIICYSYTRTTTGYLYITHWSPVFSLDIPTKKATLKLTIPKDFRFYSDVCGIGDPVVENSKATTTYTWNASFEKTMKDELYSPSLVSVVPGIKLTPEFFNYGAKGSFKSWASFGTWYSDLHKGLTQLFPEDINKVNTLVKDAGTKREKINTIYHYLQDNTRYIFVNLDYGGFKSLPAQFVSDNKYGDCKALSNYVKALLENVGIESFLVLVSGGDNYVNSGKGIPFPDFNHVILMVPDGNDTIWLDCTNQSIPFNYLGSFSSGRNALVVKNENSSFVRTPMPTYDDVQTIRKFDFKVNSLGVLDMDAVFRFRGEDFEQFLSIQSNLDLKQQRLLLNKFFSYTGLEIDNYTLNRESRDSREIVFAMSGGASHLIRKVQTEYMVSPIPFYIPDFEAPAKRKLPVRILLPMAGRDTINLEMTSALSILALPKETEIKSEFGYYRLSIKNDGNTLTMVKEMGISPGEYPIEKYPEFYSFIMNLKKFEKSCSIVLTNSVRK